MFYSCSKEIITDDNIDKPLSNPSNVGTFIDIQQTEIVLGNQLPNPYNYKIMEEAADNLYPEFTITPNFYYVRFLPANIQELSVLLDNEELDLFDYPLDYEISQEGDYYQEPSDCLKTSFLC